MLETVTAVALLDAFASRRLFGSDVEPIVADWLGSLNQIGKDLKDQKLRDIEFQAALEALYKRVDLPALLRSIDLDRLANEARFPSLGAASIPLEFDNIAGVPRSLVFGRQVFALKKGRSVIPHGHNNMATGFLVLRGQFRGRHWDRIRDAEDHMLIKPTIDATFGEGGFSTVSDHKDNVHWFTAQSETAFLFNVHVVGYNVENLKRAGRVYVDPLGEAISGGLIRAPIITYGEANRRYG